MLLFRREDRARVASGEITVTFRLWKTAKVKAGRQYRTPIGTLEIQDVQVMPAGLISRRDVPLTGCPDIEAIRALAGDHTKTRVVQDTLLYRVQFRFLGDTTPDAAPSPPSLDTLAARLAGMDSRSKRGPWTHEVLRLIESGPRIPARVLASELGWETLDFKSHVRRLKALGLTISYEIGYELSKLGREYVAAAGAVSRRRRSGAARSGRTR